MLHNRLLNVSFEETKVAQSRDIICTTGVKILREAYRALQPLKDFYQK